MKRLLVVALMLSAVSARADGFWFNGGVKGTVGTEEYRGTDWSAQIGVGKFSLKPMFSEFKSTATADFKTYAIRGGFDTDLVGLGITAGGTPKIDGYSNEFVGADIVLSLTPGSGGPIKRIGSQQETSGGARGEGLARVDIGGAVKHTFNRDNLQAKSASQSGVRGAEVLSRTGAFNLGQNDVTGSIGVKLMGALLSADITKSFYNADLTGNSIRALPGVRLAGLAAATQGLPDTNTAIRLELGQMPLITPFISYVHTRYKVGQNDSNGLTAGLNVELSILEVTASIEHLAQTGKADRNYVSLGANVRF